MLGIPTTLLSLVYVATLVGCAAGVRQDQDMIPGTSADEEEGSDERGAGGRDGDEDR
jgi:hypothetical protein